jgi:transcriptional activator SPT7
MDLGTMTKKVKNQHYQSSEEFIKDLYQIFSNCFEYNTDPKSIYRYHAQKLKEKSDDLLRDFPDYYQHHSMEGELSGNRMSPDAALNRIPSSEGTQRLLCS